VFHWDIQTLRAELIMTRSWVFLRKFVFSLKQTLYKYAYLPKFACIAGYRLTMFYGAHDSNQKNTHLFFFFPHIVFTCRKMLNASLIQSNLQALYSNISQLCRHPIPNILSNHYFLKSKKKNHCWYAPLMK